tara:strand:+ start:392 stop:1084 length:693 start_codon:yes stop_codon:yes gene_type:complete
MTYREMINEVLVRLREETMPVNWSGNINDSNTVSDYQKVIGSLVNDSKRNIESYHDWLVLRETKNITTIAGTKNYSLDSGQEFKIIDVVNNSTGNQLSQVNKRYLNQIKYPTDPIGEPNHYGFNGADASSNLKVDLSPIPIAAQVISFDIVKYQDELTLATTVVKLPTKPIILGAYARAISERGEDGGTQSSLAAQEASEAVNQAIMRDSGNTQYETDWYVSTNYHNSNR